jgi:hypothetical protein
MLDLSSTHGRISIEDLNVRKLNITFFSVNSSFLIYLKAVVLDGIEWALEQIVSVVGFTFQ